MLLIAGSIIRQDDSLGDLQCLLNRLSDSADCFGGIHNSIDNDIDRVFVFFIKFWKFIEIIDHAIDSSAGKSATAVLFWNMGKLTFL